MKYKEARLSQRVIVIFLAAFCELTGRYLFPNWDINYLLYGARFYMDNQAPWMDVWTGIDTLNGIIAMRLGSPELAITTIGLILAITATLIIDEIFVALKF